MKRFVVAAAVLVSALVGVAVSTLPASADASCGTPIVTHLPTRTDGGNHGDWAQDNITRTVTICEKSGGGYHATVVDDGTFTTVAGSSPQAGVALPADVTGTVHGSFTADFTTNPATIDLSALTSPAPATGTSVWVQTIIGAQWAGGSSINDDWSWTYATGCEQWVDAADNQDGELPADGDITGKACPTPTPTTAAPVVPPAQPTTPAAHPTTKKPAAVQAPVAQVPAVTPEPSVSPSLEDTVSPSPSAAESVTGTPSAADTPLAATVPTGGGSNAAWYWIGGSLFLGGVVALVGLARRNRRPKFPKDYASTAVLPRHVDDGPKP